MNLASPVSCPKLPARTVQGEGTTCNPGPRPGPERQLWDLPLTREGDGVHAAAARQCHHVDPDLQQSLPAAVGTLEREGRVGSMRWHIHCSPRSWPQGAKAGVEGKPPSFLNQFTFHCPHTSHARLRSDLGAKSLAHYALPQSFVSHCQIFV